MHSTATRQSLGSSEYPQQPAQRKHAPTAQQVDNTLHGSRYVLCHLHPPKCGEALEDTLRQGGEVVGEYATVEERRRAQQK